LSLSTPVLTPNGDGVHDLLRISYTLFRLPEAVPIALTVYALNGRQLARIDAGLQDSGPREISWDGRDENGQALPPGIYLLSIAPAAEFATSAQIRPLGIAY
jgi:flagellar hook assembly protein FlgD